MKTWQAVLLGVFLGLAASAVIVLVAAPPRGEPILLPPTPSPASIAVYVIGEVNTPGVVYLPRQSRVLNAVEAAGGFTKDADTEGVNLASKMNDGDRVTVFSRSAQATQMVITGTAAAEMKTSKVGTPTPVIKYPINLNTATQQELENLPNIGPAKAAQIIEYRQQNGPFKTISDIQNVPGIGPATFDKMKSMISVEP
jgi:competence protein ComEA